MIDTALVCNIRAYTCYYPRDKRMLPRIQAGPLIIDQHNAILYISQTFVSGFKWKITIKLYTSADKK